MIIIDENFMYIKYKILGNIIFRKFLNVIYNEINNDFLYNTFRRLKNETYNDYKIFCKSFYEFRNERKFILYTFNKEKLKIKRIVYNNILNKYFCYDISNLILDYIV